MGWVCIGLVFRTGAQERKSVSWMGRDELLLGSCSGYSTGMRRIWFGDFASCNIMVRAICCIYWHHSIFTSSHLTSNLRVHCQLIHRGNLFIVIFPKHSYPPNHPTIHPSSCPYQKNSILISHHNNVISLVRPLRINLVSAQKDKLLVGVLLVDFGAVRDTV